MTHLQALSPDIKSRRAFICPQLWSRPGRLAEESFQHKVRRGCPKSQVEPKILNWIILRSRKATIIIPDTERVFRGQPLVPEYGDPFPDPNRWEQQHHSRGRSLIIATGTPGQVRLAAGVFWEAPVSQQWQSSPCQRMWLSLQGMWGYRNTQRLGPTQTFSGSSQLKDKLQTP